MPKANSRAVPRCQPLRPRNRGPSVATSPGRRLSMKISAPCSSWLHLRSAGLARPVDLDALLAAVPEQIGRVIPHRVAARRLEPDDLRAVIGQDHRHERPSHALGQIDYAHSFEYLGHLGSLGPLASNRVIRSVSGAKSQSPVTPVQSSSIDIRRACRRHHGRSVRTYSVESNARSVPRSPCRRRNLPGEMPK